MLNLQGRGIGRAIAPLMVMMSGGWAIAIPAIAWSQQPYVTSPMPAPLFMPHIPPVPTPVPMPQPVPYPAPQLPLQQVMMMAGYRLVPCTQGVVTVHTHTEVVCVLPTPTLPLGDYVYDRSTNQLSPAKVVNAFDFHNAKEYSDCVEDILRLYYDRNLLKQQGRMSQCLADVFPNYLEKGISKAQARQLIESANFQATSVLQRKLFPPKGQRLRVTQMLGFIYDLDASDPVFQRLAAQAELGQPGMGGELPPDAPLQPAPPSEPRLQRVP